MGVALLWLQGHRIDLWSSRGDLEQIESYKVYLPPNQIGSQVKHVLTSRGHSKASSKAVKVSKLTSPTSNLSKVC